MVDGASISVLSGGSGDERMRLVSLVENLDVVRAEPPARVIVNARTGTVVINGAVRVGTAAVTQGRLTVSIKESPMVRSEEHTSELQSLMRISYAVFCLKKKKKRERKLGRGTRRAQPRTQLPNQYIA